MKKKAGNLVIGIIFLAGAAYGLVLAAVSLCSQSME